MSAFEIAFGGAFGRSNISELKEKYSGCCAEAAQQLSLENCSKSGYGWLSLPDADMSAIKEAGKWLKGFEAIIHVGIGGSALGNLMLKQALLGDFPSVDIPDFYVADNPDPRRLRDIWNKAKDKKTALVCVSKSGETSETMAQFFWLYEKLRERGESVDSVLVITDEKSGLLRAFAQETGCRSLVIPSNVGGRYSVLSSVGLPGAYALGMDIDKLLSGAREMRDKLLTEKSMKNPAWLYAVLNVYHEANGKHISVLMPYTSRLVHFAEWFAQLWGESLGKNGMGTTPVRASGAIDQHSQLQLYTQGPDDKLTTIINVKHHSAQAVIPVPKHKAFEKLSFFDGWELGNILQLEAKSTAASIMKAGHPVIWLELDRLDEHTLGQLIFFYEYATALTGLLMGINPFDQPGVEQGKRYTYGLIGRTGYEADAKEVDSWFKKAENSNCCL